MDWLSRYAELSEMMLRVRRLCPQLPVLAMSTLRPRHVLPPDQVQLMQDLEERDRQRGLPSLALIARRWLRCALFAARDTLSIGWLSLRFRPQLRRLMRQPAQVIMKTWCVAPPSPDDSADFYYGTLPQQLAERGIRCLLLCGDAQSQLEAGFTRAVLRREQPRGVPEHLLVPVWAPLAIAWRQLTAAIALRRLAARATDGRFFAVCRAASLGSLQPITLRNALQFYIARTAVKTWGAKVFVTLYEGQPWEQPAWLGAKAADPECMTVGFQHTVVLPSNRSLLQSQDTGQASSQPDVVLCSGPRTQALLAPSHHRSRLVAFGTFRPSPVPERLQGPRPERRTVLVIPEGILEECRLLFHFAMRSAARLPDHRFIFRCHPVMPFARVRPFLPWAPEEFPNIEVSDRAAFTDDCSRASVVLYRGSSAALYAVSHGLKPVYLHDERHRRDDPLFELAGWRERVSSEEELAQVLGRFAAATNGAASDEWRDAAEYVGAYVTPVSGAALDGFLESVGMATGPSAAG